MVRALIAGVGEFSPPRLSEDEVADGIVGFGPLPSVGPAVRELASTLDRLGVATGGDALIECDQDGFLERWRTLRRGGDGEPLVVHFAGHGFQASGGLFLAASGAQLGEELVDTCISVRKLLEDAELCERPVLFVLDVCQAGQAVVLQQLAELAAGRHQDAARTVWVIGACAATANAYGAGLTIAAAQVLQQLADGDLDVTSDLDFVPVETLAAAIDRQLAHVDAAAGRPPRSVVRTAHPIATPQPAPFFRNPASVSASGPTPPAGLDPRLRDFALGCAPGLDPLHFATRAAGDPALEEILFTGRSSALARIEDFIDDVQKESTLLVVTGGPGSGKSALLGVAACLLHPDLEPLLGRRVKNAVPGFAPRQPAAVLAVHARQLTVQQITDALRAQLRGQRQVTGPEADQKQSGDVGTGASSGPDSAASATGSEGTISVGRDELLREVRASGDVLIVVDALDEATDPAAVSTELLLPLAALEPVVKGDDASGNAAPGVRVLVGVRPWQEMLPALLTLPPSNRIDLDPATDADRAALADDLAGYLRKLLPLRHPAQSRIPTIAERLANYADHGAFLVAALYAHHLIARPDQWASGPPSNVTEVFDLHLGTLTSTEPWIRPVLAAVGRARGQGMPLELIHAVAVAHHPAPPDRPRPTLSDTRRVLSKAAFYLRAAPDDDSRLTYRYFHQALNDRTVPETDPGTVYRALMETVPSSADGTPDWMHAPPYVLRHIIDHAHQSADGSIENLLGDLEYLVFADPGTLVPHLKEATSQETLLYTDIYNTSVPRHPDRAQIAARRDLLALCASAWHQPHIARTLAEGDGHTGRPFALHWATRRYPHRGHMTDGHTRVISSVAFSPDGYDPRVAITASEDCTAIVWDLDTGTCQRILTGHKNPLTGVATTTGVDGTALVVTTSTDRTAVVWDLSTGASLHTLTGHTDWVRAVATATDGDGTPLAVTVSDDHTAIVWDLNTGTPRHRLTGHTGTVRTVTATTDTDGTPLATTTSTDGTAITWDLSTGTRRATVPHNTGRASAITATATDPDGVRLTFTASGDHTVVARDPADGTEEFRYYFPSRVGCLVAAGGDLIVTYGLDVASFR